MHFTIKESFLKKKTLLHVWHAQTALNFSLKIYVENSMEFPEKPKNRNTIWSSNSTAEYVSKENKNTTLKRDRHPNVHRSIIYNSQDMEAT